MLSRAIQLICLLVAGYLFVSITGVQLPTVQLKAPTADAATAPDQVIVLPTAKVVINSNPGLPQPPAVIYVTATPAVANIPDAPLQVVIADEQPSPLPEGVGIDEVMLGPVTADTPPIDRTRRQCTEKEWQELTAQGVTGVCTFITEVAPPKEP